MGFSDLLQVGDQSVRELLGETVTYTPGAGSPVDISGVFDKAYQFVDAGQAGVSSSGPAVFLTLSDLTSDPDDDTSARVTVGTTVYRVRESQPDGLGGILLLLHEV
jgi:hypothetical protein